MTTLPKSIPQNPNIDVSDLIQEVINALPSGATLDVACFSKYRTDKGLTYSKPISVMGNQSLFYAGSQGGSNRCMTYVKGPGVALHDYYVQGSKPLQEGYNSSYEGQHGYNLTNASSCLLDECHAFDVWGDLVYINQTTHAWIEKFVGGRTGRAWCSLIDGADIDWVSPVLDASGRSGFNCEPHGAQNTLTRVRVRDGILGYHRLNLVAMVGSPDAMIDDFRLTGCQMHTSGLSVYVQGSATTWTRRNLWFTGNVSDYPLGNSTKAAVILKHVQGAHVLTNKQPMGVDRDMHMVGTLHCEDVTSALNTGANMTGQLIAL